MTDEDLDIMIRSVDPAARTAVPTAAVAELRERIVQDGRADGNGRSRPWRPRHHLVAAAAVVAVLAVAATALLAQGTPGAATSAWSAELVAVAQEVPRLLVTAQGWAVTRADELGGDRGEMTFSDGSHDVELRWIPAAEYASRVEDRKASTVPVGPITVVGEPGTVLRYDGSTDFTALWLRAGHGLELRGVFPTAEEFQAVAASIRAVDVDTWLSAMPESVVRPDARGDTIAAMLADVPLPPGLDLGDLATEAGVSDRYQLGARATGAVACGWITEWIEARLGDDPERVAAAVTAMAGSRDWQILEEMDADGDYPEVLWQYADAMAGAPLAAESKATVENSYRDALGCEQ